MCDRLGISSVKVSSVLNKNNKEFGKKFLLDGDCETCWQSDKSNDKTQVISLKFEEKKQISKIRFQFQGGFAATKVQFNQDLTIHPKDSNQVQSFQIDYLVESDLKLVLTSSDFYGRIIVYLLDFEYV